jgi:hypothetical protein
MVGMFENLVSLTSGGLISGLPRATSKNAIMAVMKAPIKKALKISSGPIDERSFRWLMFCVVTLLANLKPTTFTGPFK